MAYYNTCPNCGANLDPGESCDCKREKKKLADFYAESIRVGSQTGQMSFQWNGKGDVKYETKIVG